MGERLVLDGVSVVDPRAGTVATGQRVWIESGRVQRVADCQGSEALGEQRTVPCRGKFLIPGFLDMHMHCMQDPNPADSLALLLSYGITGVRQMAGSSKLLSERREGKLDFGPDTPELLAMPGEVLTSANAATPKAAVEEVRKQKSEGADFIKTIFVTPKVFAASLAEAKRVGLPYGGHVSPGVDMAQASNAGLRFVEHLGPVEALLIKCSRLEFFLMALLRLRPPAAMKLSLEGGMSDAAKYIVANPVLFRLKMDAGALGKTQRLIDSFREEKSVTLAEVFARNGTWQCPTLIRNTAMQFADQAEFTDSPYLRYVPRQYRELWRDAAEQYRERLTPESRETLAQLNALSLRVTKTQADAGVKMMAGSDCGGGGGWVVPGISLHQEFDLLTRAGLGALKILQMATCNGAEFLNQQDRLGSSQAGAAANFVLLDANPLDSAENLHGIWAVVRDGRYYSKEMLEEIRERVAVRAAEG